MPKLFNFEMSEEQVNVILAGLQELPYKVSAPIVQMLIEQHRKQIDTSKNEE